jgi:hypothetical protein
MSDDKPPSGFTWGLHPSGGDAQEPEKPKSADATGAGAGSVDVGHFSVVEQRELSLPEATELDFDDGEPTAAFDFRAPEPPRIDSIETPVYHAGRALPWEQPPAFDPALDGATEALAAEPTGIGRPEGEAGAPSALDALFADDKFTPYDGESALSLVPFAPRAIAPAAPPAPPALEPPATVRPRTPDGGMPKSQRVLIWVAGALVAVLAIAGLFFVGTRIGDASTDRSTPTSPASAGPTASATPTPAATSAPVAALGPLAPGVHEWDELLGTECVEPFVSAWDEQYTVVDCAAPHGGQLAFRGRLAESANDPFPGVEALQARVDPLCASADNIDYAAASRFSDIQISASFAATADDWADGNLDYFCFVSRSSGEPLTESVAMPARPTVATPVDAVPEP